MLKQDICIGFILGKSYKSKNFESKKYSLEHLGVVYKNIDLLN